ncbi:MAG TPA: orotate phosphoribosyltransferase [Dehalococcoidia bacterium]|nr:orotate phosphoribosyltransferase [Dehalococcoidia bacterium]
MDSSAEIERLLRQAGAILEGHFLLTSGRHSGLYVEKFRILERPAYTEVLCGLVSDHFRPLGVDLVAAPTTGGIIVGYEVARQLGARSIFAEKGPQGRAFGRGFTLRPGERVLVVDDVLTTGGSLREVIAAVEAAGAMAAGIGILVDRSGGRTAFSSTGSPALPLPFFACLTLDIPSYEPAACPLCAQGLPPAAT